MPGNCLVGQSGGPTAVINASVCGVVQEAVRAQKIGSVFGVINGIEGIIYDQIFDFSLENPKEIKLLKYTPASALGSCRYKLSDISEGKEIYSKIFNQFKKYNIMYFFYIGGNDSMDTVYKLSKYARQINYDIKIIGIPKTIDNDLLLTDHSPGYGTAAKFIATSIIEIARDGDVYKQENVQIIEVMGRNTGWLAAASALAQEDYLEAPDLIYLPEIPFYLDKFLDDVQCVLDIKGKVNIVVSEGLKNEQGNFFYEKGVSRQDFFGHRQLGGVSRILGEIVQKNICQRVKVMELSVLQRSSMHIASKVDLDEAYQCGKDAVEFALAGASSKMLAIKRVSQFPYKSKTILVPVKMIANKEKSFPKKWVTAEGNCIREEAIEYIKPLIRGEVNLLMKAGLPRYAHLKKIPVK